MTIDPIKDTLIRLGALAAERGVHAATAHRWRGRGIRGVKLDAVRVGGAWYTTHAAFADFCQRLTQDANSQSSTSTTNAGACGKADAELEASKW